VRWSIYSVRLVTIPSCTQACVNVMPPNNVYLLSLPVLVAHPFLAPFQVYVVTDLDVIHMKLAVNVGDSGK
jgi:hypothetical protein